MKNFLLVFVLCAFAKYTTAQIVYSDSFDGDDLSLTQAAGYTQSIGDGLLQITADGTAAPYAALKYQPRSNGEDVTLNLAASPKIYIKIKATNAPKLRIDLRDTNGFVTNLAAKKLIHITSVKVLAPIRVNMINAADEFLNIYNRNLKMRMDLVMERKSYFIKKDN